LNTLSRTNSSQSGISQQSSLSPCPIIDNNNNNKLSQFAINLNQSADWLIPHEDDLSFSLFLPFDLYRVDTIDPGPFEKKAAANCYHQVA